MKESLLTEVFWHAGLFLALSALVIPVLRYFKIPIALGYLLAGIAIGPYALGALSQEFPLLARISLEETLHVKILAELGIVLLLFVIGLELTPRRLWQMRSFIFGLGGSQVAISALVIGTIAFLWGNNLTVSLLLGLSLALSSTAMVIQWLHEQKLFVTHAGRSSFSILLFQDLAVIPILLLLTILSADTDQNMLQFVAFSLFKMVATAAVIYFAGKILLKPVFVFANRHGGSEVFMALSLLTIVVSASIAAMAGLSMALGAFIAGVLLADTEYRHEISSIIIPFKSMLLGIFFLSFGMGINLSFITEKPFWLLSSVMGLMLIKASIIFALCKLWKQSTPVSIESAILLAQAGEFGLLVVGTALTFGLMDENVGQFMLINIGITMLLTPFLAPLSRKVGAYAETKLQSQTDPKQEEVEDKNDHVVIIGYGRMGEIVANNLSEEGIEILGFEKDVDRVHEARKKDCSVYLGDGARKATLDAANLEQASCVIITIDSPAATREIIKALRKRNLSIPIIVRAHNNKDVDQFEKSEHIHAVPEHSLVSFELSNQAIKYAYPMGDETVDEYSNKAPQAAE